MTIDDGFLQGMLGHMGSVPVLHDRGYDRGEHRFCAVLPLGAATVGGTVETDKGAYRVTHCGRPYVTTDGVAVANYYLDATPEAVGAPVDALTPEQEAYRAARRERQTAGLKRWLDAHSPEERSRMGREAYARYLTSTTKAERRAKAQAGLDEFWRIMRADLATLTPAELARRKRAEARRKRTPEQRARIAAATREGIAAKRAARQTAAPTPEQIAAAAEYLARHVQGGKP